MIDRESVEKKMDMIEEGLAYLRQAKLIDLGKFLASFEKMQATKHTLQETMEACLIVRGIPQG